MLELVEPSQHRHQLLAVVIVGVVEGVRGRMQKFVRQRVRKLFQHLLRIFAAREPSRRALDFVAPRALRIVAQARGSVGTSSRLSEPLHEVADLRLDDRFGLRDRGLAHVESFARDLAEIVDRVEKHVVEIARPAVSTSRGTARSTMRNGRCLRARSALSIKPLPMIGSMLAVQETMMSCTASCAGRSLSEIARPRKRSARCCARSTVRLANVIRCG